MDKLERKEHPVCHLNQLEQKHPGKIKIQWGKLISLGSNKWQMNSVLLVGKHTIEGSATGNSKLECKTQIAKEWIQKLCHSFDKQQTFLEHALQQSHDQFARQYLHTFCQKMGWVQPIQTIDAKESKITLSHPLLEQTLTLPWKPLQAEELRDQITALALKELQGAEVQCVYVNQSSPFSATLHDHIRGMKLIYIHPTASEALFKEMVTTWVASISNKFISFDTEWSDGAEKENLSLLTFGCGSLVLMIHLPEKWHEKNAVYRWVWEELAKHGVSQLHVLDGNNMERRAWTYLQIESKIEMVNIGDMLHEKFNFMSNLASIKKYTSWFTGWNMDAHALSKSEMIQWFQYPLSMAQIHHAMIDVVLVSQFAELLCQYQCITERVEQNRFVMKLVAK